MEIHTPSGEESHESKENPEVKPEKKPDGAREGAQSEATGTAALINADMYVRKEEYDRKVRELESKIKPDILGSVSDEGTSEPGTTLFDGED